MLARKVIFANCDVRTAEKKFRVFGKTVFALELSDPHVLKKMTVSRMRIKIGKLSTCPDENDLVFRPFYRQATRSTQQGGRAIALSDVPELIPKDMMFFRNFRFFETTVNDVRHR